MRLRDAGQTRELPFGHFTISYTSLHVPQEFCLQFVKRHFISLPPYFQLK